MGSEAGMATGADHKPVSMDVVAGAELEAASMGGHQTRSMKLHPWTDSGRGARDEAKHKAISIEILRLSLLKMDGRRVLT
jgi:hypothetical protein